MKKFSVVLSAFVLLLGLSGAAGAYNIDYAYINIANQFTSPYAGLSGTVTENFDPGPSWTWTGDGAFVTGDLSGVYSAPMGVDGINKDATRFVTVPTNLDVPNSFRATNLGGTYTYLGLWWGSVDYLFNGINNELKFYNGDDVVETITGAQAINPSNANGNQTAPGTNLYVNIYNLPLFDSFELSSNRFAFEADNFTVGQVPEPGTMMLLGTGLVGLAGLGRKKFRK